MYQRYYAKEEMSKTYFSKTKTLLRLLQWTAFLSIYIFFLFRTFYSYALPRILFLKPAQPQSCASIYYKRTPKQSTYSLVQTLTFYKVNTTQVLLAVELARYESCNLCYYIPSHAQYRTRVQAWNIVHNTVQVHQKRAEPELNQTVASLGTRVHNN